MRIVHQRDGLRLGPFRSENKLISLGV
jgi:hypothetical protein